MVFRLGRQRLEKQQELIDVQEAFNLWDIVSSKYTEIERLMMWKNVTHDKDLKMIIQYIINDLQENIKVLKQALNKFRVKGPEPNREISHAPCNSDIILDQHIANQIFLFLQEHVENLLRTIRTSMTNDWLRGLVIKMAKETIRSEARMVDYLKLKGWIRKVPLFPNTPADVKEKISTAEVYHLWDHLSFRYDNLRQTRIYLSFVFDGDFKLVLEKGLKKLTQQAKSLEKELKYFGITPPHKPSDIVFPAGNTEVMDDDHMYRMILIGLQSATILHAESIKQCIFNNRLRDMFKELLLEEIDILESFIQFGKLKGWLNPPPSYRI